MRSRPMAMLLLVAVACAGCADQREGPEQRRSGPSAETVSAESDPVRFERAGADAFIGGRRGGDGLVWDLTAADMDTDGDPDLLVNRHARGALRLYENDQGRFSAIDQTGNGASLAAHPSITTLSGRAQDIIPRARASGRQGLYLWQDDARARLWHFFWKDEIGRFGDLRLLLQTADGFSGVDGIESSELERVAPNRWGVRLVAGHGERTFRLRTQRIGSQLLAEVEGVSGRPAPPIYVGQSGLRWHGGPLELWSPDPHAVAWANVEGSAHPELFVARGALGGLLQPPLGPKSDLYYVATATERQPYALAGSDVVPGSYGDGYRVEWVDTDADGTLEVAVANRDTPNALLARLPLARGFRDRAAELGLDLEDAHVQTWADYDGDGLDDLFVLAGDKIQILRNTDGVGFEPIDGRAVGLQLPVQPGETGRHARTSLRIADFNADGALDLWVIGYGVARASYLFLRTQDGYRDVSEESGLGSAGGQTTVVLLDVDNDGFEDAVSLGRRAWLWHNQRGERFRIRRLPADLLPERVRAACALDADGDGHTDLVTAGKQLHLLRNTGATERGFLDVLLDRARAAPIGAVARAYYEDGRVLARRLGSVHVTAFSQAAGPLRFGNPVGNRITRVGVRWPGDPTEHTYDVRQSGTRLEIAR